MKKWKMNWRKNLPNFLYLALIGVAVAVFGNACGEFGGGSSGKKNKGLQSNSCEATGFDIHEGAETVSIAYGKQVLDNMVACTGLTQLSQPTIDEFESRLGSLSEFGYALDVNPPLAMAHAGIAIEVCNDLFSEENALPNAQRRIFNRIDDTGFYV